MQDGWVWASREGECTPGQPGRLSTLMPLVDSLLTAIVRSDGDALVLHVGEKPYVVAATGSVELSRQGLGVGAMEGLLAQLLSADALRSLREMGAVEHELSASAAAGADRFTVVAARGGDDIWIEIRRHRHVRPPAPAVVPAPHDEVLEVPHAPDSEPAAESPTAAVAVTAEEVVAVEPEEIVAADVPAEQPLEVVAATAEAPPVEMPAIESAPVHAVAHPVESEAAALDDAASAAAASEVVSTWVSPEPVPLPAEPFANQPVAFVESPHAEAPVAHEVEAAETPATPVPSPVEAYEPAVPVSVADVWEIEHVPAIDFELPVSDPGVPLAAESPADLPAVVAPASFEAALVAGAVPPVEPLPTVAHVEPRPTAVAAPELAPAAGVPPPVAPPAPPPAPPAPSPAPAAAARPAVPQVTEPPSVPPHAPVADAFAIPRYDAPAAAVSPRAPMPRVEPTVPEPPAYPPIDPQPTLPGLPASPLDAAARAEAPSDALPGVVLSLTRDGARTATQTSRSHGRAGGIERLLRLAAARGASALYLTTQARPAVRVDGDIRLLEGESTLSSGDVEAAVLELAPEGARDKESAEWIRDLQDVGRVRITTFRDYRGPGALLRMISARATSAEQLGLVREIQALAMEPEGLVIVTGPRASGKSTLVSAFVDLINRQRNDYVITLEGQIRLVHESRGSLISQRELRGSAGEIVSAARAALRENPDVLIIEDLRSPDVLQVALDAAGSGLLVFASVTAASATAALERLVDLCPSEQRRTVRAALAEHLRGVVAQVLLRKSGGGRLAARELVLNTNAVAALVSDGQIAQLPRAIDSGRKLGMAPLNDALVAFVQSGAVDVREAYRKADDKVGLLGLLRREGIDTSFVERLA